MNKQIKIGDIHIHLTYQFHDFFKNTLDKYEETVLSKDSNNLTILVKEILQVEEKENVFNYKNRIKYSDEKTTEIVTYFPDGNVKLIIRYTNDFKNIIIELNQLIGDRLAEYEYVLSGMMFFEIALRNKYLPIHASAIRINNQAILLSGPSKSGKSTQTKFFLEVEENASIINEDKPLIRIEDNKVYILGSPWSGKDVINNNLKLPLKAIFFLNKCDNSSIDIIPNKDKLKILLKNIHRPGDETNINHMVDVLKTIVEETNIYQFNCENNLNSARILNSFLGEE